MWNWSTRRSSKGLWYPSCYTAWMTPVSIEAAFPKSELQSHQASGITNYFMYVFKADTLHFVAIKSLGSFCPVPCSLQVSAPGSGEPAVLPQLPVQDTPLCRLSWGGPSPGKGQAMGAPMLKAFSPKLTDQFIHALRCLPENGYLLSHHLVCNRNKRAPKGHISATTCLPQGFVWVSKLALSPKCNFLKPSL